MTARIKLALLVVAVLIVGAACQQAGAGDALGKIKTQGYIRISTDPNYAPQSFINDAGDYDGFDIDVAKEIAKRLGVEARWEAPEWDTITAGSWADRWDMSVGSMTVTPDRETVLDFTQPYYYTPAQVAVADSSAAQSIDDLAGEVTCVGEATTYGYWIDGTLELGEGGKIIRQPPAGMTLTTLPTDAECAQAIRAGRTEFATWISSLTTVDAAIAEGIALRKIGTPIFYEPLAVAFDKSASAHSQLVAEVNRIVGEMHSDGTLASLSKKWFDDVDFTKAQ